MKEPQKIKLSDFEPTQKKPEQLPLKSLEQEYDCITTVEGARILVKKNENIAKNDS